MSYKQAVKHSRNHRKDRFRQPIVLGSFQVEKPLYDYFCAACTWHGNSYNRYLDTCPCCGTKLTK